jgi:uncharacterized protein (TIGR02300 family)
MGAGWSSEEVIMIRKEEERKNATRLLTARFRYGKAPVASRATSSNRVIFCFETKRTWPDMVKAEWGTKRTCPKCGTRFYDLGNDSPVVCISCNNPWDPEPTLKSKQPLPYEEVAPKKVIETADGELETADDDLDVDLDIDEDDDSPDNDVDLGGDDDLGVEAAGDDDGDDN